MTWLHETFRAIGDGEQGRVRREFPVDFTALKCFNLQPPQKTTFAKKEENDTNSRRMLFIYIANTGFSGALTTCEVGVICVIRCYSHHIRVLTRSDAGCYVS